MSNPYQYWYGLCHRCSIQGAISGFSKKLTNPIPLEAPHHCGPESWGKGYCPVSVLQSQRVSPLSGDSSHEHAPSLPHQLHISPLRKVGDGSPVHILSGTE
ncbi:hypothetical protein NPIL_183131 [Nephila pilipes]|uniref:Uncharacterized protein n=1 Tax=Nephila pilipes TaxID=299642 RepID=A0A8X6PYG0_NEPPI|nr:hypothetical protein NPIL_183131 [Nephila pilipes]